MTHARGVLVVFEGVDRSGKSTQVAQLVSRLNALGHRSSAYRFPDRQTETGKLIDAYLSASGGGLDDRTIHLLFAANRFVAEAMRSLRNSLMQGETVVVDRYAFSGVAYTLAKGAQGLDKDWCKSVDAGILKPDIVFFLDIPTQDASQRGDYGLERYEKLEFQEKVRTCFLDLVDKSNWKIMDARQTKEALSDEILGITTTMIQENGDKPLLPLWQ
ncbi:deoxythymidylate kinase, isoform CRA_b [Rhizoclosmatium globosum]|uniref:Thymidylate kinase n=1 Tax=Rhizoclosmatium globosum TaxID=329046 RepID=A0A1Y2BY28_9FUNG|nr:deoxythymidylate kinase, isoform CRA_b [Rhizoclosmatium globosum]|eukprot:ORY39574.1 deoxythymidylate kinase, isoform CRA_b [Rhizoclosmatium globosum]